MSMITTSAPRSRPRATASKATAPGSEPSGPLTKSHAGALGPALELLDRGGAERVGGADQDLLAERLAQVPGELADRRRLAGAVDADDEDHGRVGAEVDVVVAGAGELGEQLGEPLGQRLAADEVALLGLALELLDDLRRSCARRRRRRSAPPRGAPRSPRRGRPGTASPGPRPAAPRASCACSRACGGRSRGAAARARLLGRRRGAGAVGDEEVVPVSCHGTRENRAMPEEITVRAEAADSLIAARLVDAMVTEMDQLYAQAAGPRRRLRRLAVGLLAPDAGRSWSSTRTASRWRAAVSSATTTAWPRSSACTWRPRRGGRGSGGGCWRRWRRRRASSATCGSGSTRARASRTRRRCTSAPATTRSTNYNGNSMASFWGEKILR